MKFLLCIFVILLPAAKSFAQADTLQVYFDTDDAFLNEKAITSLNRSFLEVNSSNSVLIIGYADYRGDTYYNDMLSMRRAQSVAGFFLEKGLDKRNISLVYGKGAIKRKLERKGGYAQDRRVDVILSNKVQGTTNGRIATNRTTNRNHEKDSTIKEKTLADIETAEVGEALVLDNINFYLNTSSIMPQSQPSLEELYTVMKNNPGLSIQIEGHICCTETNEGIVGEMALKLSQQRAEAIYDFLLNKRIDKKRMRYAGFGRTRPKVAVEKNEKDRLANRRVEIRILSK